MVLQGVCVLTSSIQSSSPLQDFRRTSPPKRPRRVRACGSRDLHSTGSFCTAHAHKHAFIHSQRARILQFPWSSGMKFNRLPLHSLHAASKSVAFTQDIHVKEQENNVSIQKTAHISVQGVKVEGLDDEAIKSGQNADHKHSLASSESVATSADVDANSRKDDSAMTESRNVTRSYGRSLSDFKSWWNAVNDMYKSDTATWGCGTSPIFTVYEGPGGKVERVTINEEEINRRQGVEPLLAGLIDDASKAKAEDNILLAQSLARDLEQGRRYPNKHSTIITVVKHSSEDTNQTARQRLVNQVDVLVHRAAPIVKSVCMIVIPLYGISVLYGAYLMITQQSDKGIVEEEKSAARLEKMRKLKAQMATPKQDSGVTQSPMAPSEFMQKLLEVREMARQVRTEEKLQGGQNSNADPENESGGEGLVETEIVGDNDEADEGVVETEGAMNKLENQDAEPSTMESIEVIQSGDDTTGGSILASRVKPPIIMSLEEAMAGIGERETLKNICTTSEKPEGTTSETIKSQVDQESVNVHSHVSDVIVRSDVLDDSFEEGFQGAGQIFDADPEYESRGQDSLDRENVRDNDEMKERMVEIERGMTETKNQDAHPTTMGISEVTKSGRVTTGGNRVKPRIITSLDEAMAVIGETEILDKDFTTCEHMEGTMPKTFVSRFDQESIDVNSQAPDVIVRPDVLDGSSADLVNGSMVDQAMPVVQPGQPEKQNPQIPDVEVAANDVSSRLTGALDQLTSEGQLERQNTQRAPSDVNGRLMGALDKVTSEGQPREEQEALETRANEVSDGLKDSDEAASSSENGKLAKEAATSHSTASRLGNPNPSKNYGRPPDQRREVSPQPLSRKFTKQSSLSLITKDVVGSGQPLRGREPFSNTKRWSEELQRKYDSERDPEVRELMNEIGSELDSWVTEEEVEEAWRLALKLQEGAEEDAVRKQYEKVQRKIGEEKDKFGLEAMMEKYKEYQPKPQDELWWLDLRCVLCLMVVSANKEEGGFYGLDMALEPTEAKKNDQMVARHVVAFEDPKDASNFVRLLELRSGSRFQRARVCPFSPKQLYRAAKEEGFKVTVLRTGQIRTHVDQTLEEVEERILEIGRSSYLDEEERERCIDIDSILHQRFGL